MNDRLLHLFLLALFGLRGLGGFEAIAGEKVILEKVETSFLEHDAKTKAALLRGLMESDNVFAHDLAWRLSPSLPEGTVSLPPDLLATSLAKSHYISLVERSERFSDLFAKCDRETQLAVLESLAKHYGKDSMNYSAHQLPEALRSVLVGLAGNEYGDPMEALIGPSREDPADGDKLVKSIIALVKDKDRFLTQEASDLLGQALELCAEDKAFAKSLMPAATAIYRELARRGDVDGWQATTAAALPLGLLGVGNDLYGYTQELDTHCINAMQDVFMSFVRRVILKHKTPGSQALKETRALQADQALAASIGQGLMTVTPPDFAYRADIGREIDAASLSPPISFYVARIQANAGNKKGEQVLEKARKELRSLAVAIADRNSTEANRKAMVRDFCLKAGFFLSCTRAEMDNPDLRFLVAESDKVAKVAPKDSPDIQNLERYIDFRVTTGPDADRDNDDGLDVNEFQKAYSEGKLTLREFVDQMALGADITHPSVYRAIAANRDTAWKEINDGVLLSRILYAHGTAKDEGLLHACWYDGRPRARRGIVAIVEKLKLRSYLEVYMERYDRMPVPLRQVVADMLRRLAKPKDLQYILKRIEATEDPKCLEYLTEALLSLLREKECSQSIQRKLKEARATNSSPRLVFYIDSAIRIYNLQKKPTQ